MELYKYKTMSNWHKKTLSVIMVIFLVGTSIIPVSAGIESKFNTILGKNQEYSSLDFDQNITTLMKQAHIPGLSACVIKNNGVVWYGGYGFYDRLLFWKKPNADTVFSVNCITKPVTATAILQLYEQGKITSLDDDVNKYLDFSLRNPSYPDVPITFRMLLSHQSSLSMDENSKVFIPLACILGFPRYAYKILKKFLIPDGLLYKPEVWLDYPPGDEYNYSNIGFQILAYLVERISGQSFGAYCNEHIFKPLDMNNTGFYRNEIEEKKNFARNYISLGRVYIDVGLPRMLPKNYPMPGPTGLATSVSDLSHFLIAQMNNGTYNGKRILKNETIQLMHTIQYPKNGYQYDPTHKYGNVLGFRVGYGFGWGFYNVSGIMYQGHQGAYLSFAEMRFRVSDNVGVIFFYNTLLDGFLDIKAKIFYNLYLKADEFQ